MAIKKSRLTPKGMMMKQNLMFAGGPSRAMMPASSMFKGSVNVQRAKKKR